MNSEEKIKTTANLSYCGYEIPNVHIATNLSEFKNQFIKEYSLQNQIKEDDNISISYKENEKKININNEEDYHKMLDNFINSQKDKIIYIDTDKIPLHFDGKKSIDFEDEIKKVIERESLIAANNIKKCLTTNLNISNSQKVRLQSCVKCNKQIIGYLYKAINPLENDKYYCELCSIDSEVPLFKID